jgi:hypothetical protein
MLSTSTGNSLRKSYVISHPGAMLDQEETVWTM